jgi:hypothetical protein
MLMNYHIGRLVLSSLCVGVFFASGFRWCSFCRQKLQISNTQRTENKSTDVVIHQHSRRFLKMDILMSVTCWAHNKWNKIASDIKLVFHSSTNGKFFITAARTSKLAEYFFCVLPFLKPSGAVKLCYCRTHSKINFTNGGSLINSITAVPYRAFHNVLRD